MKISISRHYIYILLFSIFMLLFVFLFAFLGLIPKGKEYREQRMELKKSRMKLQQYQEYHDTIYAKLKDLQSKNRHIITAFENRFDAKKFQREHKNYFSSLKLSKISQEKDDGEFALYEVNTTSRISSPKNFYDFLDAVNKSDWIIWVNFPITFKRDGENISSSFTMKVYSNKEDSNATASASKLK